jgi:hypothetical protein
VIFEAVNGQKSLENQNDNLSAYCLSTFEITRVIWLRYRTALKVRRLYCYEKTSKSDGQRNRAN